MAGKDPPNGVLRDFKQALIENIILDGKLTAAGSFLNQPLLFFQGTFLQPLLTSTP